MLQTPSTPTFVATIDPGAQTWIQAEWEAYCEEVGLADPKVVRWSGHMRGVVRISAVGKPEHVEAGVLFLRSVHHVSRLVGRFQLSEVDPLDQLREIVLTAPLDRFDQANAFRASCNRVGAHPFGSHEVMIVVGQAARDRFGTQVDLTGYDLDLRVDVYEQEGWIGYQLTRKPLSQRFERRVYHRRTALKSSVAFLLLRMAGIETEELGVLLDPFCGGGTILLEAGQLFPDMKLWGSDMHIEPVEGTQQNLEVYQLGQRAEIRQVDVRTLAEHYEPESVDYIVTNPPYGLKMGKGLDVGVLYRRFLDGAQVVLKPGGTLVMLVLKAAKLRSAAKASGGWQVLEQNRIEVGGKMLSAFRLEKQAKQ